MFADTATPIARLKNLPDPFQGGLIPAVIPAVQHEFNRESWFPDARAHRVEQGGIGFSIDEPIGTEHVGNCVAVIARDPVTGKTGLAHYDAVSTVNSLQNLFDRLPERRLQVVMIGAMYDEHTTGNDYLRDTSASNLKEVLNFLSEKDVDIIAARIHDPGQPTNFTVDPKDFTFRPVSPDLANADKDLVFARKFLTGHKQPLAVEFDLTQSKDRFPYFFDQEQITNLNTYVKGKNREDVAAWHRSLGGRCGFEYIQADLSLGPYMAAYQKAKESLIDRYGLSEGVASSKPLYVGLNADAANARIFGPQPPNPVWTMTPSI